jgi:hypothetical protein
VLRGGGISGARGGGRGQTQNEWGVFAKRQFSLLSTKINFSPRAQTQNIRTCSLYDLDVVDRFAISSKWRALLQNFQSRG